MRLKSYLVEGSTRMLLPLEEAVMLINKDCKAYLREFKRKPLYRSIGKENVAYRVVPRLDRRPLDTSRDVHDALNVAFKELFGWNVRSGVFVSLDGMWDYNDMVFFAGGKYRYMYSPNIVDLYRYGGDTLIRKMVFDGEPEKIIDWIKEMKYTDKGLNRQTNTEISFDCKYYYLLNKEHMKEFYQ